MKFKNDTPYVFEGAAMLAGWISLSVFFENTKYFDKPGFWAMIAVTYLSVSVVIRLMRSYSK